MQTIRPVRRCAAEARTRRVSTWLLGGLVAGAVAAAGCQNKGMPSAEAIAQSAQQEEVVVPLQHNGPRVELADTGPARFVRLTYNAYRTDRAMEMVRFMDVRHRTPGSTGFDEVLDEVERQLREQGFGSTPGLELKILESEMDGPSWEGKSATITLHTKAGGEAVLHSFSKPRDRDRLILPQNAPAANVTGEVAFDLEELDAGEILVTEAKTEPNVLRRAKSKGAAAVISASLGIYNVDPTGRERQQDAVYFRTLPSEPVLPSGQISPRSFELIREAYDRDGGASITLVADAEFGDKQVKTVVATIVGASKPDEVVVLASHVMAPGACDNASGAAGQLECCLTLARILERGGLERPARSLTFLWGVEKLETTTWLAETKRRPVAAVNAVMVGESRAETGAMPLLERFPDPGAHDPLPPDEHTIWGMMEVDEELMIPNGLSIVARCAMVDVALHVGDWETSENPYEGGTDHEKYIEAGVPVVLFWHFTDFAFGTSLDRLSMVDEEEMRRMSITALTTALAMADPRPTDLDRYLKSLVEEKRMRIGAATEWDEPELAEAWRVWFEGARQWLRIHCLSLDGEDAVLPTPRKDSEDS